MDGNPDGSEHPLRGRDSDFASDTAKLRPYLPYSWATTPFLVDAA